MDKEQWNYYEDLIEEISKLKMENINQCQCEFIKSNNRKNDRNK